MQDEAYKSPGQEGPNKESAENGSLNKNFNENDEESAGESAKNDISEKTDTDIKDNAGPADDKVKTNTKSTEPVDEKPILSKPANQAFVVISERDDLNKECIAGLLKAGARPIILNDVNEKRSLIEIIAQNPQVKFALVILSGDDFVYDRLSGKPGQALLSPKSNTVFHMGFLLAKLGNMGTMMLYRDQKSFVLPTGIQNANFVPYNKEGAWQEILKSKLRSQGIIS